jgi:ubiquinone/menaquinone biosynthesis C-methylase UbiE
MAINDAAARGFERGADDYERARPGYPQAVFDLLTDELPLRPRTRACDLAAGTGKFTRGLLNSGATVVAVEPVHAMRRKLAVVCPEAEILDGTAEAIPLADHSIDVVTVAQAFHWFEAEPALAEIRRVLRPGGGLALVWNVRDESVDWVHQFTELIVERSGGRPYTPYHATARGDAEAMDERLAVMDEVGGFTPLRHATFDNSQPIDVDGVVSRAASTSFVSALPDDRREALLAEVRHLVETHPQTAGRERFAFPHRTDVTWCHAV